MAIDRPRALLKRDVSMRTSRSLTLLEVIIVVIIVSIIASFGFGFWQNQLERDHAENARTTLKMVLQGEENYFSWKNRYTDLWSQLEIDDPNNRDKFYQYNLENVEGKNITIRATRRGKTTGYTIDTQGNIQPF